ncbi:related to DNA mismatch repair protein PMS2 [Phialocephala subalpina]|uniref:Related to DNA mismatch repair protein PMS2 n=1 Tax=Phialocephala subalpina TaxID=576137 RepID=A0A1L7WDS4_9HELO|nr:related to DNA mismatch repair protein PMS2 [Phialocephala subalpina]
MTITALPAATIRLLGSAQALTTPTSLVKELIDNALDARATAIDILISTNTIDKIEVRDNGHGIPQEDLDALGRHGHTSKLRSFDELRSIGGLSLGFRGEALASACQLGEVSVTTKTEGEPAATAVKLKPLGGIASRSRTSNPIGTTVTVTNFLFKIPVRKQTALKDASKVLNKLKDLLLAYCLARPQVRFSLKVMKSPKGSWFYAPRPNDRIKDAVSLVIGRDTASQCMEKSLAFTESGYKDDVTEDGHETTDIDAGGPSAENESHQFVIDMFLPKPGADASKIGHGQYISIDTRPVSHDKGTMRKIVTLFRSYLKDSLSDSSDKLKNPFLWMDIRCPVASYDANVEPAKDDVLFCNEALLLESIERAFEDAYGKRKEPPVPVPQNKYAGLIEDFNLLKARVLTPRKANNVESSPTSTRHSEPIFENSTAPSPATTTQSQGVHCSADAIEEDEDEGPVGAQQPNFSVGMSEDYSEEIEGLFKSNRRTDILNTLQSSSLPSQASRGNSLNPWLIAKMTAPLQRDQGGIPTASSASSNKRVEQSDLFLPTPQRSSDPLSPDSDLGMNVSRPRQTFHIEDITSLALPPTQPTSRQPHGMRQPSLELESELLLGDDWTTFRRRNDFVSARQVPDDPMIPMVPAQPNSSKKWSSVNKPFVPPMRSNQGAAPPDGFRQTKLNIVNRPSRTVSNPQELPDEIDLEWAMDFEQRKEGATRQRREQLRIARVEEKFRQAQEDARLYGQSEEEVRSSPHKNRYNAAIATLEADNEMSRSIVPTKEPFKTTLADGDPRAYLMKRQRSMSVRLGEAPKLSRAKSMRLPLERIPENQKLHSLLLPLPADMTTLRKINAGLKHTDMYIQCGVIGAGFPPGSPEEEEITKKVQAVFKNWKGWKGNMFQEQDEGGRVQISVSG